MSYLIAFLLAIILAIIMNLLDLSMVVGTMITFFVVFVVLFYPLLHTVLWETNVKKIEKFLIKKRKYPMYQLIYAMANELDDEVEHAVEKLLKTQKQGHKQALYKTMLALYKKELVTAKHEIEKIQPIAYQNYYKAAVLIEEEDFASARKVIEQIPTSWMKNALLSDIEKKENHYEVAMNLAKKALEEAKGLNKYTLYKTYQREFPELN